MLATPVHTCSDTDGPWPSPSPAVLPQPFLRGALLPTRACCPYASWVPGPCRTLMVPWSWEGIPCADGQVCGSVRG